MSVRDGLRDGHATGVRAVAGRGCGGPRVARAAGCRGGTCAAGGGRGGEWRRGEAREGEARGGGFCPGVVAGSCRVCVSVPLQHAGLRMCGAPVHGGAGGAQRAGAGERPREGGTGGAALSQPPRGAGCSPGLARPPGTGALRAAAVRLLPRAWCAGGSERVGGLRCGAVGARTRGRAARLRPGGSEGSQELELYL